MSALLLGTGSTAFVILWLYFLYWFMKNKMREVSATCSVLSKLERLDSKGLNPSFWDFAPAMGERQSTEFVRSRIYTTITGAKYHDEKSFVESVVRTWDGRTPDFSVDQTPAGSGTQTHPPVEDYLDEQLSMRVSLEDYSLGLKLSQLCGISGDLIQRNEFDISDRESSTLLPANKHEVVIRHRETGLKIVLPKRPSGTGVETKFVGFLNDVLRQKNSDGRFFVEDRHATFATPEQMYVVLEIIEAARATAPRYCCISAELRSKT